MYWLRVQKDLISCKILLTDMENLVFQQEYVAHLVFDPYAVEVKTASGA
jgi:hypothetical protein